MNSYTVICVLFICVSVTSAALQCNSPPYKETPKDWVTMTNECVALMRNQVKEELTAAVTYMAMGAYFSRDTVNRPGFAKMFFESASEEREHAMKVLGYLLKRGDLREDVSSLIPTITPEKVSWDGQGAIGALKTALNLETKVTNLILEIIKKCEKPNDAENAFNDYHLVDYLTADFLEEQYNGQRDLAGKISTLGKMMDNHGPLGEFLYDKKLLDGDVATLH